jgi:hypothetical protein
LTGLGAVARPHSGKSRPAEPFARRRYSPEGAQGFRIALPADSNQEQIDQRKYGNADADGDQDIIGTDVALRIGRGWAGFTGHLRSLGQAKSNSV